MKRILSMLGIIVIIALLCVGCGKSEQESQKETETTNETNPDLSKYSTSSQQSFGVMKADYLKSFKTKLEDLSKRIETLQLKKEGAPPALQVPIEAALKIAVEKNSLLSDQFTNLENADEKAFSSEKTKMNELISGAEKAYENLRSQF